MVALCLIKMFYIFHTHKQYFSFTSIYFRNDPKTAHLFWFCSRAVEVSSGVKIEKIYSNILS